MRRSSLLAATLLLAFGAICFDRGDANARSQASLRDFYIARFYFSDYLPAWSNTILDIQPHGNDVRVQLIRISQANDFCPGLVVRAAEHIFPNTSPEKIAGGDLCLFSPEGVDAALKKAAPKFAEDPSDSATETIVAKCGTQEKEFDFPYPVEVDQNALERNDPRVAHLWNTYYRVFRAALGEKFDFNSVTPQQDAQMETLGTMLIPELISGKYQTAYASSKCGNQDCDNYLAWELKDYKGPTPPHDPGVATLLDASRFRFAKYVAPAMPRIAQVAHVYGDVRLRLLVDPETGVVTKADAISGPQILSRAATDTARSWQFVPQTLSGEPVEATLRFELRCR